MEFFEPYSRFSQVYDRSMETVSYKNWANFLAKTYLKWQNSLPNRILDLGSGTGRFLALFEASLDELTQRSEGGKPLERFFQGVDGSFEMIQIAKKLRKNSKTWNWIPSKLEDYRSEEVFDFVISTHTTINYLQDPALMFGIANSSLESGGCLFFDFTSRRNIVLNFHGKKYRENLGEVELEWATRFQELENLIHVELTFYDLDSGEPVGMEYHKQYFHDLSKIEASLKKHKFRILSIGGDYTEGKAYPNVDICHIFAKKE